MYKTNTIETTIIDQIDKFLKNRFGFEFVFKKLGSIRTNIAIKNNVGTIRSNPILTIPETFSFLEKFLYTWI